MGKKYILIIIIIPFQLPGAGIDGAGRDRSRQTPGEGGGESMAASFVTNQKYGIIGFPANREINKQIRHPGHGHLLLLGYLGHSKTLPAPYWDSQLGGKLVGSI